MVTHSKRQYEAWSDDHLTALSSGSLRHPSNRRAKTPVRGVKVTGGMGVNKRVNTQPRPKKVKKTQDRVR